MLLKIIAIYLYIFLNNFNILLINAETDLDDKTFCFQEKGYLFDSPECESVKNNLCNEIICPEVGKCPKNGNENSLHSYKVEPNITFHGCCHACVTYLSPNNEEICDTRSKLVLCSNGEKCDAVKNKCLPINSNKCLSEYNLKKDAQGSPFTYIDHDDQRTKHDLPIKYSKNLKLPVCDSSGHYDMKQCVKDKCFCVDPENGEFLYGIFDEIESENITCECAKHHYNLLNQKDLNAAADANIEYYSRIHEHCNSKGNYEKLQCRDNICYCVDERTGVPDFSDFNDYDSRNGRILSPPPKVTIFEALHTLPCFDEEYSKKIGTKDAYANYMRQCEKQLLRSKGLTYYFKKKGVTIRGLDNVECQYDGRFSPRQCTQKNCNCVNPEGTSGSYANDRASGSDTLMKCRCARHEYENDHNHKSYDRFTCGARGDFNAFQCPEQNMCYCIDENGSAISEEFKSSEFDQYLKEKRLQRTKEELCMYMREFIQFK